MDLRKSYSFLFFSFKFGKNLIHHSWTKYSNLRFPHKIPSQQINHDIHRVNFEKAVAEMPQRKTRTKKSEKLEAFDRSWSD